MKFSIVTISFNQSQFLEQAILSVIEQDYPDVEYIVVDAGSTDGSREIIDKYRDRIDHVIFEPDDGPANGLNKGFARATGDVYGYLNSDDVLLPGALKAVARAFKQHSDADVISGHLFLVDQNLAPIRRLRASKFSSKGFIYGGVQVAQQSTFIRRDSFRCVGGFNESNRTGWDAELMLEISLKGGVFKVTDDYLALFRIHSGSITGSRRLQQEYIKDCERYFFRVTGRKRRKIDFWLSQWFHFRKWVDDPVGFGIRIHDSFIKPSRALASINFTKINQYCSKNYR